MNIIKRDGSEVAFNIERIKTAIQKANAEVAEQARLEPWWIDAIAKDIESVAQQSLYPLNVEDIQDMVIMRLGKQAPVVSMAYNNYRIHRMMIRKANSTDDQILSLLERDNEEVKQENSNKNPIVNAVQRDYMAGEVSKDLCKRFLIPSRVWDAHEKGIIHFHDTDYFAQHMHNCCLVNLEDMLQNGTVISDTMIDPPKSFQTACTIATQAIAQIASSQYGGQSISLSHLAPFVDISRQKHRRDAKAEGELIGIQYTDEQLDVIAESRLKSEIKAGVQTIQYQVITLMTTNGQAPFITINMYLNEVEDGQLKDDLALIIEEVLHQRIKGVKNEVGVYITPAFPKLIYVLEEDNITPDSKYWYLTQLSVKCTAKRMVPDYVSEKIMKQYKVDYTGEGKCYPPMGCRSFLTPDRCNENDANALNFTGDGRYYGRFNQGVVTLNLVDVACSSGKDEDKFWKILEDRLDICHEGLRCRHERLLGTPSDVAPILWQHGALARLKKGEVIDKLLYNGHSTISLGYAGLYEMTYYMKGVSHTSPGGKEFAMAVMQKLNDACAKWKEAENIDYSVYGTPLESTTYKFAKCLQKRFGMIENVTSFNYITNSYHVNVREKINAFDKLSFEAPFQPLSPGGAISYIEVPNMNTNPDALISVVQYMYDNIMYAEINTKSDYCQECGFDGEIQIESNEHGKLIWKCPQCGNTNQDTMNVARRTCGYIGENFWNQGRTQEIKHRVLHL